MKLDSVIGASEPSTSIQCNYSKTVDWNHSSRDPEDRARLTRILEEEDIESRRAGLLQCVKYMSANIFQMQEDAASTTADDRVLPIVAEIGATIPRGSTCIMKLSLSRTSDDQGRYVKPKENVPFTSQPSTGWDDAIQYQMQFAYRLQHKLSNFMTDRQFVYSFEMLQFISVSRKWRRAVAWRPFLL